MTLQIVAYLAGFAAFLAAVACIHNLNARFNVNLWLAAITVVAADYFIHLVWYGFYPDCFWCTKTGNWRCTPEKPEQPTP